MTDRRVDPLAHCELHDVQNCAIYHPPAPTYRTGTRVDVPEGWFVSVRGGKGVYHHPDCFNVTGDWDGAESATLGERLPHSREELAASDLRPAECCQPPLFHR